MADIVKLEKNGTEVIPEQAYKATNDAQGQPIHTTYAKLGTTTTTGIVAKHASGIIPIKGTGTVAGTWLGADSRITAYYDGLTIAYYINIAGASTTTLNINSLGAVTVRRDNGNLTTHLPVGTVVLLTYSTMSGTAYWHWADWADGDIKTRQSRTTNTDNTNRPLLLAYSDNTNVTANVDQIVYRSNDIYANPYSGKITAITFEGSATGVTNALLVTLVKTMHPIGSIYMSVNSKNPNDTGGDFAGMGMTWVAFGAGRVPIGVGSTTDAASSTQTLASTAEATGGRFAPSMPSHNHGGYTGNYNVSGSAGPFYTRDWDASGSGNMSVSSADAGGCSFKGTDRKGTITLSDNHAHVVCSDSSGDTTTGNAMPYIGVYMWKRTA